MNSVVMDYNKGPNVNVAGWLCGNMQKENDLKYKGRGPQSDS